MLDAPSDEIAGSFAVFHVTKYGQEHKRKLSGNKIQDLKFGL